MLKYLGMGAAAAAFLVSLQGESAAASSCATLSRSNLVRCATGASLERKALEAELEAAEGRIEASEPWLPSSPELEGTLSRRHAAAGTVVNWSARLGVELEVAGQRGARRAAGVAERRAAASRVAAASRASAAAVFEAYFDALAARGRAAVLERLLALSERVVQAARGASQRGVAAGVEADLAEAGHVDVLQRRLQAGRDERLALITLASLVGLPSGEPPVLLGGLEPLTAAESVRSGMPPESPDAAALEAERRASSARASALRRGRVPNPRVSLFVERDGFYEDVAGVGLSLPLPLPEPIGHQHAGEIREQEALATRAAVLAERVRRTSRLELVRAVERYASARAAVQAYDRERLARAEATLGSLGGEVEAGRVSVRDAMLLERPLLELLLRAVDAQHELCQASVEVVRTAGLPFEGGAR